MESCLNLWKRKWMKDEVKWGNKLPSKCVDEWINEWTCFLDPNSICPLINAWCFNANNVAF